MMAAFQVQITDPIFIGDFLGSLLALPAVLLFAVWVSAVGLSNRIIGVIGAAAGVLLSFFIILAAVGTLIFDQPLPGVNGISAFFVSFLLGSILGLLGCIITDQFILHNSVRSIG